VTVGAVTENDVRELLADRRIFPDLPADLPADAELVIDSMALVWLLHQVKARFGVDADPEDSELEEFTSIARITAYLNQVRA
jgi:acyl carrier protein